VSRDLHSVPLASAEVRVGRVRLVIDMIQEDAPEMESSRFVDVKSWSRQKGCEDARHTDRHLLGTVGLDSLESWCCISVCDRKGSGMQDYTPRRLYDIAVYLTTKGQANWRGQLVVSSCDNDRRQLEFYKTIARDSKRR